MSVPFLQGISFLWEQNTGRTILRTRYPSPESSDCGARTWATLFGLVFKGLGIVCSLVEAWLDHMICYVDT